MNTSRRERTAGGRVGLGRAGVALARVGMVALAWGAGSGVARAGLVWEATRLRFEPSYGEKHVEGVFKFTNSGPDAVRIRKIGTSCSCTNARFPKEPVPPGGSGEVAVKFVFGHRVGEYLKPATVFTDSKAEEETVLQMSVRIPAAIDAVPQLVFWQAGGPAEEKRIALTVNTPEALSVSVESTREEIPAVLRTIEAGRRYEVVLKPRSTVRTVAANIRIHVAPPGDYRIPTVLAAVK